MAELNKEIAAKLWETLSIELDRFHAKIVKHPNSVFLGYMDVTIEIPKLPGFALKLRGIELKILKGKPFVDFPSERGADGVYYPQYFPKSAEMRAVLTNVLFADARVQATIESAAQVPEETGDDEGTEGTQANADNPFN